MAKRKSNDTDFSGDADTPVEIRHPDTGFEFGVTYKTFTDSYADEGFEIVRRSDGVPVTKAEADERAQALADSTKPAEEPVGVPEAPAEGESGE